MHRNRPGFGLLAVLLVALVVTSACGAAAGPANTPTAAPTTASPTTQPATAPAGQAGAAVQVTDAANRLVELKEPAQRIVVVGRGPYMALHTLYLFPEASERLVGMEKKGSTADDFLPFVDPAFDQKTIMEANPNAEQIAALDPDLVLMKGSTVDQMSDSLGTLGIPVIYLSLETPELFFQDVTNLGVLLGDEARAGEIIDFYQARLERIQEGIAGLAEDEKPRVLIQEYSDRNGTVAVQVPAKSWIQTIEAETAGGHPVWLDSAAITDGWTVTNLEQVAAWDPDKIFTVVWYTLDPQQVIDTFKADPQWSKLKAVKNNESYAFPTDLYGWDSPEPRWILGTMWLATRIYPDRFADMDMTEEIYQFFGEMYGMDKSAVDAHILPKVLMDVH